MSGSGDRRWFSINWGVNVAWRERDVKDPSGSWSVMGGRDIYDRQSETGTPFSLLTPSLHSHNPFWAPLPGKFSKHLIVLSFLSQTSVACTLRNLTPITSSRFYPAFSLKPINEENLNDTFWAGTVGQALLKSRAHKDKCSMVPAITAAVSQWGCQAHTELTVAQGKVVPLIDGPVVSLP